MSVAHPGSSASNAEGSRRGGSLARVTAELERLGLADGLITFETSTATAALAACAVGCELGQIVKSLVFVVEDRVVLALVAGDRRGDADAIAREAGGTKARFADPETVRSATGYAIGGVSPFDLPEELLVLVDDSLRRFETVYPAAGTPSSAVRMSLDALLDVTKGRMATISTPPR